jgi:hypothetical protein
MSLLGVVFGVGLVRLAPDDRGFLLLLYLVGFGLRVLVGGLLYHLAEALGASPFILPDAWAYDWVASTMAQAWQGEPIWIDTGNEYLINHYTRLVAGLYWALGHSVLAVLALNAVFGAAAGVLISMATGRIFGRRTGRIAGLAAVFFPSVFFWSILLLKDVFYLFLLAVCLWALTELIVGHRPVSMVPLLLSWYVISDVRNFAFLVLGVLIPFAFLIGAPFPNARRLLMTALLAGVMSLLMVNQLTGHYLRDDAMAALEYHRMANAMNAETGFVPTPTPRPTSIGQPPALPVGAVPGESSPEVVSVPIDTSATVDGSELPTSESAASREVLSAFPDTPSNAVVGDRFAVLTPAPQGRVVVATMPPAPGTLLSSDTETMGRPPSSLSRTLQYLPSGIWYLLGAPFPWETPKLSQKATIPDMLLWYLSVALAVLGLVVSRRRWRFLVLPLGYVLGIGLLLALVEGNVGTLFRHRAMLIPITTIFSAAGAIWLWDWWAQKRALPASVPNGRAPPP